jgi:GINS complex subunit 3
VPSSPNALADSDLSDTLLQIRKGAPVAMPLWLASFLAPQQFAGQNALSMDLPTSLAPRVMNALKANPRTVDLRAQAPYFYALAALALELFEEDEMVETLLETFKARAAEIADHAHNTHGALGEGVDFLRGLDEMERQLFRKAHESSKGMRVWMGEQRKK